MKRFFGFISVLLVVTLILVPMVAVNAEEKLEIEDFKLNGYTIILHTNDSHGRAIPDSYGGNMGFTAVSAIKKFCKAAGAEVILMDAGDTLHGLPFATISKGQTIVDIMNLAGYDVMTPGNHDFNYGTKRLLELSENMEFPLLSANVILKDGGDKLLESNTIIEKSGVKYGVFGLSTPETAYKTNPNNVATVEFANPVEAAKKEVANLKGAGADVIIALAHLGIDGSSEFTSELVAEQVDGIDLIVDGHSHSKLDTGLQVEDTLIVSAGEYMQNIGVVAIDSEGEMQAGLVNVTQFAKTDEALDIFVKEITTEQDEILAEEVGYTSVYLDGVRENVRTKETNLGNLVTDAFRYATGADVAITNGGGIRGSIEVGEITKKDLVTVFPFGNYIVTKNITGVALLEALELGVSAYPNPLGGFSQVSGVTFSIDVSKPAGNRIQDLKVNGEDIDLNATYLFATNDFIIAGGDGYTMLADFEVVNEYGSMEEILIDYISYLGDIDIETEDRIFVSGDNVSGDNVIGEIEETKEEVNSIEADNVVKEEVTDNVVEKEVKYYTYKVVNGDYLRKIAVKLYGNESEWKKIYEWNKDSISNPDSIYIGQKLTIYSN